jgi:hypothetical protein
VTATWRVVGSAAIVASVLSIAAPGAIPAAAAEVGGAGWWTTSPLPSPPDTDDRLVVQGSPDPEAPLSYAAVSFDLLPGETATALTLTLAEGSVSTPVTELVACPLLEDFEPALGGPMRDAPTYDCDAGVSAELDGDGYTFVAGSLVDGDRLAVAVLPTLPTDRVVLEVPDDGALSTLALGGPAGGGEAELGLTTPAADPPGPHVPAGGVAPPAMGPLPSHGLPPALPAPEAAPPQGSTSAADTSGGQTALGPREDLANTRPTLDDDGASPLAALAFLALTAGAVTLWLRAGRADPDELDVDRSVHGAAA